MASVFFKVFRRFGTSTNNLCLHLHFHCNNCNETICLTINPNENIHWKSEKIDLNIIFEDEDILVINKPFGLVTHPGAGNWSGTLANALLYYDQDLSKLDRAGIVHRLDKNTSGLMVVSKNMKSQKFLVEQLQNHLV